MVLTTTVRDTLYASMPHKECDQQDSQSRIRIKEMHINIIHTDIHHMLFMHTTTSLVLLFEHAMTLVVMHRQLSFFTAVLRRLYERKLSSAV